MPVAPESYAWITIDDVKAFGNIKPEEDAGDETVVTDTLQRIVNAACLTIIDASDQEFRRIRKSGARVFPVGESFAESRTLRVDPFTTPTLVRIMDAYGNVFDPLVTLYTPLPWNVDTARQPFDRLEFNPVLAIPLRAVGIGPARVEVTATWGWPAVPSNVVQWAILTAYMWYARDVEKFGATFNLDTQRVDLPKLLPDVVAEGCDSYREFGIE